MQQLEFFDIPSPCIGVCESGPRGYCIGCFRSREERTHWHSIDDATKRIIVQACTRRKRSHIARQRQQQQSDTHFNQGSLF
ncbi:DUF1289 domain-containing protein [Glaciecola sp. XM2]|jgi:predicted Fe-S protein YdhL (DUF1289 family)|uniref:DUF1289 domain-containing protein n=1 Tax=Glaciecola sp. XM2 TaxID=1914931 RepID=UPI001BDED5E7|nr:DUF1289 domain-containing protein [Glaciecola sp. XM2]MBT1450537.1 DUF1289 domain-containing protein [Glaciecola sp. XM2]